VVLLLLNTVLHEGRIEVPDLARVHPEQVQMLREGATLEAQAVQLDEREELAREESFVVSQALEDGPPCLHL